MLLMMTKMTKMMLMLMIENRAVIKRKVAIDVCKFFVRNVFMQSWVELLSSVTGCKKPCEDRDMAPGCYKQQSRKPVPVGVTRSCSTPIAFRHQVSIGSTGMRCLRSLKTIRVITGILICTNG